MRLLTHAAVLRGARVVAPLAFGSVAYAAYIVMAIGVGRAKRTQFNWVDHRRRRRVNVALNLILIPPYGMMGAAVATVAAYVADVPRDDLVRAARVPDAVPVAAGRHGRRRGGRARPRSASCSTWARAAALALIARLPARALGLGFYLPVERTDCGGSSRCSGSGRRARSARSLREQEHVQREISAATTTRPRSSRFLFTSAPITSRSAREHHQRHEREGDPEREHDLAHHERP